MIADGEIQRARLAYEASLRAIDHQRHALEDLRSRTGVLLAAASLSASFLGARAFDGHANLALIVIALAALVVTLLLSVTILAPRKTLIFSTAGDAPYRDLHQVDEPAEQHRHLVHWLDTFWTANQSPLQQLTKRFEIAAIALVVQVLCWVLAVAATLE
jgi:hypothetical protein